MAVRNVCSIFVCSYYDMVKGLFTLKDPPNQFKAETLKSNIYGNEEEKAMPSCAISDLYSTQPQRTVQYYV